MLMSGVLLGAATERSTRKPSAITEAMPTRGTIGRRRSRRSGAPTRAGTSCWSGTASPIATSARRTISRPPPQPGDRPAPSCAPSSKADRNIAKFNEIRVTPMSSACRHSSLTISSLVPLGIGASAHQSATPIGAPRPSEASPPPHQCNSPVAALLPPEPAPPPPAGSRRRPDPRAGRAPIRTRSSVSVSRQASAF